MKKKILILIILTIIFLPIIKVDAVTKVSCGNIDNIPQKIPELTSFIVTVIQIAVPVILVIMGSIDLFKGVAAQKEDEIKKGQQMLIKRIIVAVVIFFVIVVTKLFVSLIADSTDSDNISKCIDCFLSGTKECTTQPGGGSSGGSPTPVNPTNPNPGHATLN